LKALRKLTAAPGADIVDIPIPKAGPHDLIVKVKATAMCKSDVDVYEWGPLIAEANYKTPFTMGHEYAGEVVEVGELVKNFKPGDRIAGETHIPCGYCYECRTGNQHICRNGMRVLGRTHDGCFAEYIQVPEITGIKLPPDADFIEASLLEPLGTALHALQKAEPSGKRIGILGVGTIGLMAVELAKALGATQIFTLDINEARLEQSLKLGADVAINGLKQDFVEEVRKHTKQLDAVVDLTGNMKVINQAIDALGVAGRLVHVGMVERELVIPNYMYRVVYRELILTGLFGRNMFSTWELLNKIMEAKKVDLSAYVGKVMPLAEYETAIKVFDDLLGRAILIP